jgi:transcriptional regulator with XRE-family HTH domain
MLQEEFGKLFGVYKGTVANYEKGTRKPDAEYLNKILQYFPDINPSWLLTGQGQMKLEMTNDASSRQVFTESGPQQMSTKDPIKVAFLEDWCNLSEVGQMRIWMLLKEELQKEKAAKKEAS